MSKKKLKKELDKAIHEVCLSVRKNQFVPKDRAETVKALASLVEARALLSGGAGSRRKVRKDGKSDKN